MEHPYTILNNYLNVLKAKIKISLFLVRNNLAVSLISSVRLTKLPAIDDRFKPFFHFSITSNFDNSEESMLFSGMDSNFNLAIEKAISEFTEALTVHKIFGSNNHNRSGFATHMTENLAREKSYLELIERDSFLMHYFHPQLQNKIIFQKENNSYLYYINELQSIDKNISVFMATIFNKNENLYYIGLSAGDSTSTQENLFQIAINEAIMLENFWTTPRFIIKNNFKEKTLETHLNSLINLETRKAFNILLDGGKDIITQFNIDRARIKHITHAKLSNRFVVQSEHPDILELKFGNSFVNNKSEYDLKMSNRGLTITNWNLHPLL